MKIVFQLLQNASWPILSPRRLLPIILRFLQHVCHAEKTMMNSLAVNRYAFGSWQPGNEVGSASLGRSVADVTVREHISKEPTSRLLADRTAEQIGCEMTSGAEAEPRHCPALPSSLFPRIT